jgi:hypothetical protein
MSLEMAHKVIVPPKKNYIPQFLKQRDINSYFFSQKPDKIILEPSTEKSSAFFLYVTESAQNFMFPHEYINFVFSSLQNPD